MSPCAKATMADPATDVVDTTPTKKHRNSKTPLREPYQVSLSQTFVFLLLILSSLASYYVGTMVRQKILIHLGENETSDILGWLEWVVKVDTKTAPEKAEAPWVHCGSQEDALCSIQVPTTVESESSSDSDSDDDEGSSSSEAHGRQQLLADVSDMDPETLIPTLLRLASSDGWTLKSHQCFNESTSCVLLFQEGHYMLLHKPSHHLNIFYAEDEYHLEDWLDSLPLITKWAYEKRGINTDPAVFDAGLSDMYNDMLGRLGFSHKRMIAKEESPFQEVAIYDTTGPNNFQKDRQLYLDGVVQSRKHGERAYHEALVHPVMLAHPNPERVAIVGAGEGATLREVLKHSTLKQVVMIEIDPLVMSMSREHLPEWNDCSDLLLPEGMVNPTGNCFDDPRAKVYAEDAIQWFVDRYPKSGEATEAAFDVIIMDALDPGDKIEFSDLLFDNTDLVATFHRALSEEGIFGCQMGEQYHMRDPMPLWTRDRHSVSFVRNLGEVGFWRIYNYEEPRTRFGGLWSYLAASKARGVQRWLANPSQIDLELQQRAMPTKSGTWPFHYYDGATHQSYQAADLALAAVTCLATPQFASCQRGFGLNGGPHVPASEALTQQGGTVVAQQDLEPGTYVGLDECVHQTWEIPHDTNVLIDSMESSSSVPNMKSWKTFKFLFGTPAPMLGHYAKTVDMGNDAWKQNCRLSDPTYELFVPGVDDPMLDRSWRTYECAARRTVHQRVPAGSRVDCLKPTV